MKFSPFVALFLIWVIPVKPIHADSQAELHWGAKGSDRPPKMPTMIPKMHRTKPSKPITYDDSRGFAKLGNIRGLTSCMLI